MVWIRLAHFLSLANRRVEVDDGRKVLVCERDGEEVAVEFDTLLLALGRQANVTGFGLEELGVALGAVDRFMHLEHDYPDRSVSIHFFLVHGWKNEPAGLEGQALRWVSPAQLGDQNILPADVPVIEALQQMAS